MAVTLDPDQAGHISQDAAQDQQSPQGSTQQIVCFISSTPSSSSFTIKASGSGFDILSLVLINNLYHVVLPVDYPRPCLCLFGLRSLLQRYNHCLYIVPDQQHKCQLGLRDKQVNPRPWLPQNPLPPKQTRKCTDDRAQVSGNDITNL